MILSCAFETTFVFLFFDIFLYFFMIFFFFISIFFDEKLANFGEIFLIKWNIIIENRFIINKSQIESHLPKKISPKNFYFHQKKFHQKNSGL